jgi:hypothetical protein
MFFKKGLRDPALICKLAMKNPRISEAMFAITKKYALAKRRPSTLGNRRRRRTQATWTSLARPRAMTRRGKQIVLSTQWNDHDVTRSTGPGQVNLMASWIASPFSTPRESTRPETVTDQKKKPKEPKGDFPEAHKEVNHIYVGPNSYESRGKQKLKALEVMAVSLATPEYL